MSSTLQGPERAVPARDRRVTVSIVSHGHTRLVVALLRQLAACGDEAIVHVVVTHNLPVPDGVLPEGLPFQLTELRNPVPAGFGTNHNRAFAHCDTGYFCVLNPDVELVSEDIWRQLVAALAGQALGCAYPVLLNADGSVQDNEREALTPCALVRRHVLKPPNRAGRVDWVSAAFWLLPARTFRELGGFDERYRLYCEDVDFCFRLQLRGGHLIKVPAVAMHDARRDSRRRGTHLAWHLASLARLWRGRVMWRYLRWLRSQGAASG